MKTFAALFFVFLLVILINVYSQGGNDAVRKWFGAKFANKTYRRPPEPRRRHKSSRHKAATR